MAFKDSLGETLLGGAFSLFGGSRANKQRRQEAARNREFQRMMSSTAYQRQTRDLEAAGLNRILGYTKGGPASTPGGAMAQQQDIFTPAVSTALQARRLKADIGLIDANTALAEAKAKVISPATEAGEALGQVIKLIKDSINTGKAAGDARRQKTKDFLKRLNPFGVRTTPIIRQKQYKLRKFKQRKSKGSATPIPRKY